MLNSLRLPATFRAFSHRNYLLWFVGQGISLIGTWMQTMAQQVLVYRLTGSAASLGLISFIGLIPIIPLSLWGGSITDRFPKRTILLITQGVMLVQAFLLAVLTWIGTVQIGHVYVLAFVLGAAIAIDLPARQAFTVDLIEGKDDLISAIGLNSAMFNGARAIGPALAGILIATTGEANTLLQFVTPNELRGRVMGVYTMTFQVMFRLGGLQAGVMADWLSAPISLGIGAVSSLLYGVFVVIRYPKVRLL
ncbi:MAG: hypothetical protein A2Z71_04075 [Chloroflexi bacterium RBG_13_50_21]|nr:MAG: hypothetical protein A2Z71_04075 [Chloroflexi bacterium RBG_13_50_21]OGO63072.1 MAG: hypothetical protein A2029_15035 [Chloroflexi bacterium RBG_19FT_COMBO_47_9]